jgi:ABC-type Mn2+/Zn2+ transport system ATPase subunit
MKYTKFSIENYRAITDKLEIKLSSNIIPLVGINECGKTTILQGLFCFDYINDSEMGGSHLANMINLYDIVPQGDCIISAEIECTTNELVECVREVIQNLTMPPKTASPTVRSAVQRASEPHIGQLQEFITNCQSVSGITIDRNLSNGGEYSSHALDQLPTEAGDMVCRAVIRKLPYILYNDDFNDRPVSEIDLTDENATWYKIFERVFQATNPACSLKTMLTLDDRRRKSMLINVQAHLRETLTGSWSNIPPEKRDIDIYLEENTVNKTLSIYIHESVNGLTRVFNVTDRSKGFIWYYNFIMKIRYNPKCGGETNKTMFLLDEPGSYLHETAQADLCQKLRGISETEGTVIYCTHSPRLLLPGVIPYSSILIVEKAATRGIRVFPVSTKNDTLSRRNTAMQPIYEALMIPEYQTIGTDEGILCVEGIYDKYCIELFCDIPDHVRILPAVSADAIYNNISYFIAFRKRYLALWDNDTEGKKAFGLAQKNFGRIEAANFAVLPDRHNKGKVRMEDMIESADYVVIKIALGLAEDATYESMLTALYELNTVEKKQVVDLVSDKTKQAFTALSSLVQKHLTVVAPG